MKLHFIFLLYLSILTSSCQQNNICCIKFNGVDIPIKDSLNNFVNELLLSDIANNIEIIPLQTNKESVFNHIFSLSVGETDLFINSYEKIHRFDIKNGKYINNIGVLGNGPTDFYYCSGIGIDDKSKLIYVYSGVNANNEMKTYSYEGKFIKSVHIARPGAFMEGGFAKNKEYRGSLFIGNKHFIRRMLPIQDGTKDLWQIGIFDTVGQKIVSFYDPANIKYQKKINENRIVGRGYNIPDIKGFWGADSPILNQYFNHVNFLFDSNDTVYQYFEHDKTLQPKYILQCGDRPDFEEIRITGKNKKFFEYIFVCNILETKNYLYLIAEQNNYSYLLRIDLKTGSISSIKNEGVLIEQELSKIYTRKVPPPGFTNDLSGGMPFFPHFQNEKQWIMEYKAEELLEQINLEKLKKSKVLFPKKRDQLVKIIENLKEDDNSIIMIVNLK